MKKIIDKFKKKKEEVESLEEIDLTEITQDQVVWIVNQIDSLVKENPNDYDLGQAVRNFYRSKINQLKEQQLKEQEDGKV